MKKILALLVLVIVVIALWMNNKKQEEQPAPANIVTAAYSDGTTTVEASFNNDDHTVTFTHPELGTETLPQAISGSGARYANEDETLVFWEHQSELTITKEGVDVFKGIALNAQTTQTTPSPLVGTWMWTKTEMNDESVTTPVRSDAFTITFTDEGNVSGTTDCNGFAGTYSLPAQGAIVLGPLASTKMFCEGSQESEFHRTLSDVDQYVLVSDTKLVLNIKFDSGGMHFSKVVEE